MLLRRLCAMCGWQCSHQGIILLILWSGAKQMWHDTCLFTSRKYNTRPLFNLIIDEDCAPYVDTPASPALQMDATPHTRQSYITMVNSTKIMPPICEIFNVLHHIPAMRTVHRRRNERGFADKIDGPVYARHIDDNVDHVTA